MNKRKKAHIAQTIEQLLPQPSATDPQGSWTGLPLEPDELPVQDADDL